jgi:hypothetical protein
VSDRTTGQRERRVERVQLETDRHRIVGDLTLPPGGYQGRFSDALNRPELTFIALEDVEVFPVGGGNAERHRFLVVSKSHVRMAIPLERDDTRG